MLFRSYFNGISWATTTKVITGTARGLTNVAIALDASNDNVYVAYTGRTTAATAATGNVYWNISKDNMTTWGTERGQENTAATDIYGVDLTTVSDQRIFVSWDNKTANTLLGDTIAFTFTVCVPVVVAWIPGKMSAIVSQRSVFAVLLSHETNIR